MLLGILVTLPHLRGHHRHHHLFLKTTPTLQVMLLDKNTRVLPWRVRCLLLQRSYEYVSSGACDHCYLKNVWNDFKWNWLSLYWVHYTKPGMSCPVVRYAPIPAMIPIMASLPLSFSAIAFDCLSFIRKYLVLLVLLLRMHRLLLRNLALLPIR